MLESSRSYFDFVHASQLRSLKVPKSQANSARVLQEVHIWRDFPRQISFHPAKLFEYLSVSQTLQCCWINIIKGSHQSRALQTTLSKPPTQHHSHFKMENQQLTGYPRRPQVLRIPPRLTLQVRGPQVVMPPRTYYCMRAYHGYTIPQPNPESLRRAPPFRGWAADMNEAERAQKREQRARGFKKGMYWVWMSIFLMLIVAGSGAAAFGLLCFGEGRK